jgi:hypothetical protein
MKCFGNKVINCVFKFVTWLCSNSNIIYLFYVKLQNLHCNGAFITTNIIKHLQSFCWFNCDAIYRSHYTIIQLQFHAHSALTLLFQLFHKTVTQLGKYCEY